MFWNVEVVAFQSTFYLEIHQNNIFYFLKNIFDISISKQYEHKNKKFQQKKLNFNRSSFKPQSQTDI